MQLTPERAKLLSAGGAGGTGTTGNGGNGGAGGYADPPVWASTAAFGVLVATPNQALVGAAVTAVARPRPAMRSVVPGDRRTSQIGAGGAGGNGGKATSIVLTPWVVLSVAPGWGTSPVMPAAPAVTPGV